MAITGGARGIGRAAAERFAAAGYAVSIADLDAEVPTDVADVAAVGRWIARTVATFGGVDVLINNAGISRRAPFLELAPADFDRVIAVNLRGTFLCAQAAARVMVARGAGGAIVNIASTRASMSEPGTEAYTASKGGIVALTHGLAMSLGPHGIRVNCISPGWIETRAAFTHSERDRLQHPVGRVGRPEDVAEACLFLAEQAPFMTGQNLVLDGGMTVKMIYE